MHYVMCVTLTTPGVRESGPGGRPCGAAVPYECRQGNANSQNALWACHSTLDKSCDPYFLKNK